MNIPKNILENKNLWNYEVIQAFNELNYEGLLTKKDLSSNKEVVIKEALRFVENDKGEITEELLQINNYFYILQKNTDRFLLSSQQINKLPIQVKEKEKIAYNKEGFWLIHKFSPVGFTSQKCMSFRELIDNFAFFEHSDSAQFKLWKILVLSAYISRINVRISTEPAFGKDSIVRLLDDLMEHVGVVQKPTLAKLEYLTNNKLILVNEFVNLNNTELRDIEQYLLTIGDFSNKYQKRSRANAGFGGTEEYDTSRLSVILTYNNKDCYPEDIKYFDDAHSKQIRERFLPFKFSGKLLHAFTREITPSIMAKNNKDFYIAIARTIKYYSDDTNVRKELKEYTETELLKDFKDRWKINFETIIKFINLYSSDEKEYKRMIGLLYNCHIDYLEMVDGKGNKNLNNPFYIKNMDVTEYDVVNVEEVEESLGE